MFIPKPKKSDYAEAKAYCPISLSSFLLKTMKKLVDRHIRDGILKELGGTESEWDTSAAGLG
jgi:hypothetical protein